MQRCLALTLSDVPWYWWQEDEKKKEGKEGKESKKGKKKSSKARHCGTGALSLFHLFDTLHRMS